MFLAPEVVQKDVIRILYISSGFHDHAITHLVRGVLREHNKSRFHVTCMSHSNSGGQPTIHDEFSSQITNYCEEYTDIDAV